MLGRNELHLAQKIIVESVYQTLLASKLSERQYWLLTLLLKTLQCIKDVKLEQLAHQLPLPILMDSRRRKLQRFLSLRHWTVEQIWWPIILNWLTRKFPPTSTLYVALDRTQWGHTNFIVISLIYRRRAIPIDFKLLNKLTNQELKKLK